MAGRNKGRRSSILKSRNSIGPGADGGSGDIQRFGFSSRGVEVGVEPATTRNLRRVSFSQTNEIKEFEKSNSSAEGSLTKNADFNQTMCEGINMSITMCEGDDGGRENRHPVASAERTQMEFVDMSIVEPRRSGTQADFDMSITICKDEAKGRENRRASLGRTRNELVDMSVIDRRKSVSQVNSDMSFVQYWEEEAMKTDKRRHPPATAERTQMGLVDMSIVEPRRSGTQADFDMSITICKDEAKGRENRRASLGRTRNELVDMSVIDRRKSVSQVNSDTSFVQYWEEEAMKTDKRRHPPATAERTQMGLVDMSIVEPRRSGTQADSNLNALVAPEPEPVPSPQITPTSAASNPPNLYFSKPTREELRDGGSGDIQRFGFSSRGVEVGVEPATTRNLRRVSFSQTNEIKEFEKSNSSAEGSLTKNADFNQTMCEAINMSITMCEGDGDGRENRHPVASAERTQMEFVDMSIVEPRRSGTQADINLNSLIAPEPEPLPSPQITPTSAASNPPKLYFSKPTREELRDPFRKPKKTTEKQFSFGKFSNLKTPKRNRVMGPLIPVPTVTVPSASLVPTTTKTQIQTQTSQAQHSKSFGIQTSPWLNETQKVKQQSRDVGLNCTIGQSPLEPKRHCAVFQTIQETVQANDSTSSATPEKLRSQSYIGQKPEDVYEEPRLTPGFSHSMRIISENECIRDTDRTNDSISAPEDVHVQSVRLILEDTKLPCDEVHLIGTLDRASPQDLIEATDRTNDSISTPEDVHMQSVRDEPASELGLEDAKLPYNEVHLNGTFERASPQDLDLGSTDRITDSGSTSTPEAIHVQSVPNKVDSFEKPALTLELNADNSRPPSSEMHHNLALNRSASEEVVEETDGRNEDSISTAPEDVHEQSVLHELASELGLEEAELPSNEVHQNDMLDRESPQDIIEATDRSNDSVSTPEVAHAQSASNKAENFQKPAPTMELILDDSRPPFSQIPQNRAMNRSAPEVEEPGRNYGTIPAPEFVHVQSVRNEPRDYFNLNEPASASELNLGDSRQPVNDCTLDRTTPQDIQNPNGTIDSTSAVDVIARRIETYLRKSDPFLTDISELMDPIEAMDYLDEIMDALVPLRNEEYREIVRRYSGRLSNVFELVNMRRFTKEERTAFYRRNFC